MSIVDQDLQTQLANIEKRSGKSLEQLVEIVLASGTSKHSEIRKKLLTELGLGYGDATMLTSYALKTLNSELANQDSLPLDAIIDNLYSGPKTDLRPIHDKLLSEINKFGDFEIAPKKSTSASAANGNSPTSAPQPEPGLIWV